MYFKRFFAIALLAWCNAGVASDYPNRPISLVVNQPAGGGTDAVARGIADELGKRLGQPVVVENKPGGSGTIGLQAMARAKADGYTLSVSATTPLTYGPHTMASLPFNPQSDFAYISLVNGIQLVLAVNQDVPAKNMKEFMAWAQRHKGSVSYGSTGPGGAAHLISAYVSNTRNLDMTHVPYKGEAPMVQDLVSGTIPWAIGTKGVMAPFLSSGRLRALAVIGDHRFADLPEVPTMSEAGFGGPEFKPLGGFGLLAPAGTPQAVLERLEKEARAAARVPRMMAIYQTYGLELVGSSASEFRREIEAAGPIVEKLVKAAGFKPGE